LEPGNWRHYFRLGHASWGEERLRAAAHTLALYPDFAFAHFQRAMVFVARGELGEAETILRQGAAVQDRQIERGERYPALGLHWLLALVRLAQGDADDTLRELDREQALAEPHRLYGPEYSMHAHHARASCLLRIGRRADAAAGFRAALDIYADYGPSLIGLAVAERPPNARALDRAAATRVNGIIRTLSTTRPVQAVVVRSQLAAAEGREAEANALLVDVLQQAPAGFAAWTLPVDPLLSQLIQKKELSEALRRLERRAA
jgi:tetratricopeptide (TPR) repeat protein